MDLRQSKCFENQPRPDPRPGGDAHHGAFLAGHGAGGQPVSDQQARVRFGSCLSLCVRRSPSSAPVLPGCSLHGCMTALLHRRRGDLFGQRLQRSHSTIWCARVRPRPVWRKTTSAGCSIDDEVTSAEPIRSRWARIIQPERQRSCWRVGTPALPIIPDIWCTGPRRAATRAHVNSLAAGPRAFVRGPPAPRLESASCLLLKTPALLVSRVIGLDASSFVDVTPTASAVFVPRGPGRAPTNPGRVPVPGRVPRARTDGARPLSLAGFRQSLPVVTETRSPDRSRSPPRSDETLFEDAANPQLKFYLPRYRLAEQAVSGTRSSG